MQDKHYGHSSSISQGFVYKDYCGPSYSTGISELRTSQPKDSYERNYSTGISELQTPTLKYRCERNYSTGIAEHQTPLPKDSYRDNPFPGELFSRSIPCMVDRLSCTSYNCAKKEDLVMSYATAIKNFNRIVLASDSRCTIKNDNKTVSFSDQFEKIVYLPLQKLGIVSTGINVIDGVLLTDILKKMDSTELSAMSVREKFSQILVKLQEMIPDNVIINIACGGFDDGKATLLYSNVSRGKAEIQDVESIWHTNEHATDLFKNKSTGRLDVNLPDVRSMIKFAEFLVHTEIEYSRYSTTFPLAGGPIQTLLLEPEGAKWIHTLEEL